MTEAVSDGHMVRAKTNRAGLIIDSIDMVLHEGVELRARQQDAIHALEIVSNNRRDNRETLLKYTKTSILVFI